MQTRRDQLHAYRFQNKRALAALVTGEPNVLEPPMRRLTAMTISGIMVAVLIAVGAALVGLLRPDSGDKWRQAGAIIVERDTGARYVLFPGNVLHPVLNYSSAVLAVGGSDGGSKPHVVFVDAGDIKGATRGALIGVPGLPDSLPPASGLLGGPWTVCSRETTATVDHLDAQVGLTVGTTVTASAVARGTAVYVTDLADRAQYLLLGGRRFALGGAGVATALNLSNQKPLPVGPAFLDALPAGPALAVSPADLTGAGTPSHTVSVNGDAVTVGAVLETRDNDTVKDYLALDDGIAALTPLEAALFRSLPIGPGGQRVTPVTAPSSIQFNTTQSTQWKTLSTRFDGLPTAVPETDARAGTVGGVCGVYSTSAKTFSFVIPRSSLPTTFVPPEVQESATAARGQADVVSVTPGGAALVHSPLARTTFLLAAPGQKFAMTGDAVFGAFGYADARTDRSVELPAQLLALIPSGNPLDPTAARRPVTG